MATSAQVEANQANAQHSTGPKTEAGKANSSHNNFRHGFTGEFCLLPAEDPDSYSQLLQQLQFEHGPTSFTESVLVERMAQHHWLRARAIQLQNSLFVMPAKDQQNTDRQFALYLRYQTTNERAFSKCLSDLLKLRAERRKERWDEAALSQRAEDSRIGFESQQLKKDDLARKQSIENRKQELHKIDIWLAQAKAEHQELLNHRLETPEMRIPNRVQRILAHTQAA